MIQHYQLSQGSLLLLGGFLSWLTADVYLSPLRIGRDSFRHRPKPPAMELTLRYPMSYEGDERARVKY